jgi:hypothetical protein
MSRIRAEAGSPPQVPDRDTAFCSTAHPKSKVEANRVLPNMPNEQQPPKGYTDLPIELPNGTDANVRVQKFNAPPRLLTLKAAAHFLSMGEWKLRRLVWSGDLAVVQERKGARLLFDVADLNRFIETNKK